MSLAGGSFGLVGSDGFGESNVTGGFGRSGWSSGSGTSGRFGVELHNQIRIQSL